MTKKIGTIFIGVMEGRNLVAMDSDGHSDPYCVVIVGDKKKRTKAVRHNLNPKWEAENFEFSLDPSIHNVVVEVFDWDRFSTDDPMGMVVIPVASVIDTMVDTIKWYPLVPMKQDDKVSGDLRLRVRYEKEKAEQEKNPLIKAIKDHDIVGVEHLLSKSKTDINVCDAEGSPAVHIAATTNNIPLLMLLLKATELKITSKDPHGNTPLHIFSQKCLVLTNEDPVTKLIEKGCFVNTENAIGEIPLHKACLSTTPKTVTLEVLLNKGSNINHKTKAGETPLHYAIKMGRNEFVRLLIQRGADFNVEGGKPPKKPSDLARELGHTAILNRIQQSQEISEWLSNLQLDALVPTFIENDMFLDVLPDVDESTLDSLKITVSGQRTKLLRAVKKLKSGSLSSSNSSFSASTSGLSESMASTTISMSGSMRGSAINTSSGNLNISCNNSGSTPINLSSSSVDAISSSGNNIVNSNNSEPKLNGSTNSTSPVVASPINDNNNNNNNNIVNNNKPTTTTTPIDDKNNSNNNNNKNSSNDDDNNNNNTPKDLEIPDAKGKEININYQDLAHLKHTHLEDNTSWVIDESSLKFLNLLGVGASGKVYKGTYNGTVVAIKVLKAFTDAKDIQEFKKEFQIVSALKAPGVVYFYGAGIKDKLCIVMEFCSRGSLYHILKDETVQFTWNNLFHLAVQAISSLNSLHTWSPQILHRDLKSLNLLVTEDWVVKICDFGLSRFDTGSNLETLGKLRGTYAYVAPEVYFGNKYTLKSDVYSMGMIIWEMIYRCINGAHQFPYQEYPNLKFDYQILIASAKKDMRPTFPPSTPQCLVDIISKTLLKDSTLRPTTQELYDEMTKCRNEYLANQEEWDAKRTIPEQQKFPNSQPPPPPTAAASPVSPDKPASALPDHLTRSRSNSSPVEPSLLLKKSSKNLILH
ncbi:ankyrin repeat-containing protein [Heterostelium album PN500]|uniref:non-specific serine/threonine protein kinase n=1 Tax=Heterostelium pallidum (strain ATCC 26659 / Pp 5 / PN500) TaxID=670386 RepID=D3B2B5_HETP5|nr:ankyrin repeat-containing protein [Heterostelium album PN500]EFA84490.1 ankyrin repeat-containing protein [Heterostelium album PN500]|eukprot:XP_020436604.1 ankyrin repeat-containing protein [Heterostelium album PN500]